MNNKKEYRDLDKWRKTKEKSKRKNYRQTQNARNSGKPYSEKEIELILKHGMTDRELSKIIGRSVQAIQVKRSKINSES